MHPLDNAPAPIARPAVTPHVRRPYRRSGAERMVSGAIVNRARAATEGRLGTLERVLVEVQQNPLARHCAVAAAPYDAPNAASQLDIFECARQQDLARGRAILREGVDQYARLLPTEAAHLAKARVKVHVARLAGDADLPALEGDLRRLESALFSVSLTRLGDGDKNSLRSLF